MTKKNHFLRFVFFTLLLIGVGLYILNNMIENLLFFPERDFWQQPQEYSLDYEDVELRTSDGVLLHAWFLKANPSKATLLFLHGNAGNISHRLFKTAPLVTAGVNVLLVDYRGFGKSEGKIKNKEDLFKDAKAALDWLINQKGIPPNQITLFGESIGSAPTLKLAQDYPVANVILEAPFTTIKDLAKIHYPAFLSFLADSFNYDNLENIKALKLPLLIIHGNRDEICPYEIGKRLFDHAPGEKQLFTVPNAGHNDIVEHAGPTYFEKILQFIRLR